MDRESKTLSSSWAVLWQTVATDRLVQLTAAVFAVTVALYLLPILSATQMALVSGALGPFVFLGLVVTALWSDLDRVQKEERRFWREVGIAFLAWLAVAFLYLFFPGVDRPLALGLVVEALYAVFYVALILAAERHPDRAHRWRPASFERPFVLPATLVFTLGLFGYFFVIPSLGAGSGSDSWSPTYVLYLTLGAYLTARFLVLSRTASSPRWRTLYLVLALTMGALFVNDLLELLVYSEAPMKWGGALDLVYYAPFLIIVMTRCRHLPFPREPVSPVPTEHRPEIQLVRPSRRTMIHALAFPLLHFGCYNLALLAPEHRPAREVLVFWLVLVLGSIAIIQQGRLEKRARELLRDRQKVESSLRNSEKDLRLMVERYHSDQKLRLSEEKLAKVFRVSPDGMAITSLPEGRIKEVNDNFELLTGYCREDIIGRTAIELDLWAIPADRQRMLEAIERDGSIRDMETRLRLRSGQILTGLLSAETLTVDGESYLVSVVHDITERKRMEEKLKTQAVLLDKAQDAIAVLDLEDRVTYWNRSAERLYGWSAGEALGRPASELLCGTSGPTALEAAAKVEEKGDWIGEMEQVRKDGSKILVESWWTLVRDGEGNPASKLVISSEVTGKVLDQG